MRSPSSVLLLAQARREEDKLTKRIFLRLMSMAYPRGMENKLLLSLLGFPYPYHRPPACLADWFEATGVKSCERLCFGAWLIQVSHSSSLWELPGFLRKVMISLPHTKVNPGGTRAVARTELLCSVGWSASPSSPTSPPNYFLLEVSLWCSN